MSEQQAYNPTYNLTKRARFGLKIYKGEVLASHKAVSDLMEVDVLDKGYDPYIAYIISLAPGQENECLWDREVEQKGDAP